MSFNNTTQKRSQSVIRNYGNAFISKRHFRIKYTEKNNLFFPKRNLSPAFKTRHDFNRIQQNLRKNEISKNEDNWKESIEDICSEINRDHYELLNGVETRIRSGNPNSRLNTRNILNRKGISSDGQQLQPYNIGNSYFTPLKYTSINEEINPPSPKTLKMINRNIECNSLTDKELKLYQDILLRNHMLLQKIKAIILFNPSKSAEIIYKVNCIKF